MHSFGTTEGGEGLVEGPFNGVLDRLIEHEGQGRHCGKTQL